MASHCPAQRRTRPKGSFPTMFPAQDTMSGVMLESIGAIVTGQAIVRHSLAELAEDDLVHAVELEFRGARAIGASLASRCAAILAGVQEKIEKLIQVESHVNSLLDRLQQETIAVRSRSAALLLRPLAQHGDICRPTIWSAGRRYDQRRRDAARLQHAGKSQGAPARPGGLLHPAKHRGAGTPACDAARSGTGGWASDC